MTRLPRHLERLARRTVITFGDRAAPFSLVSNLLAVVVVYKFLIGLADVVKDSDPNTTIVLDGELMISEIEEELSRQ